MGYVSKKGRRPTEYASKSSHSYIIKENAVISFLSNCNLPKPAEEINIPESNIISIDNNKNTINYVIAVDGGYTEATVVKEYPSAKISFLQFGALFFNLRDLEELENKKFIDPIDISKLKNIQRFKFVVPTKNITLKDEKTLLDSVRKTIYKYFLSQPEDERFIDTLRWFIFEEYNNGKVVWNLANCPNCNHTKINLDKNTMKDYSFNCPNCNEIIFLTDVFRFHEVIDNELGAGGILGYLITLLENLVIIHLLKIILQTKPNLLEEVVFIKDGPLAFFGQTANMFKPMRKLVNYLYENYNLFLVGLEKSGAFVEHADEISSKLESGKALILHNDYIYKYIIPGKLNSDNIYGKTTYYGNKVILKSKDDKVYVATIPTLNTIANPEIKDFCNLKAVLQIVEKLRCDMYDSSIIPIALVNKLVSLANHPSSKLLEKFAIDNIK